MQELSAKLRNEFGKKTSALRRAGFLPAVVYGEGVKPESITVPMRDFEKAYGEAGESSVLTLSIDGAKKLNVMIHDVAHDPITSKPIHADFYSVRMDKEIEAKIPFVFAGEPPAVKNEGGVLVKVMQEIEIRALPADLPHEINVDISRLEKIGDRIYVKDVAFPPRTKARSDGDEVVALIEAPRSEEELKSLETAAAPEVQEVKTEREMKLEEKADKVSEEKAEQASSK